MTDIIAKTYAFLDTLDKSKLIKDLTKYKKRLMNNEAFLKEVSAIKNITNNEKLITKRKVIYQNNDYKMYMQNYNELALIIMQINKKYKEYTNTKIHHCH